MKHTPYYVLITLAIGLSACAYNPATEELDVVTMSESSEIKKGREMHEKILASMPIYQDEKLQTYVDSIGQKMALVSDRPDLQYHFTIIDSPDSNAFALPGGYIYINRGLMAYLNSEAELAAVLGHEIAHVTARHAVRQQSARHGAGALSVAAIIATGSSSVSETANLLSNAAISGYGRDMELEADRFGAEYLHEAGYPPQAMMEVIGVLKDQERYAKQQAKASGKKVKTYHGVFSSHPRNDKRLQEVVAQAGELDSYTNNSWRAQEYRRQTQGMIIGNNYDVLATGDPSKTNRFSHKKLGFTLVYPEKWTVENQRSAIVAQGPNKTAKLTLTVDALDAPLSPADYINQKLNIGLLKESEPLRQSGLIGQTGLATVDGEQQRIAVLLQGRRAYTLTGTAKAEDFSTLDTEYIKTIRSFRPFNGSQTNGKPKRSKTLHYVRATEHTTFKALAKHTGLGARGEQQLRLLNGYYPSGEPEAGDWLKIIK